MRPVDEPISSVELLYRAVGADHVSGPAVLPTAVDMQGTSVHRSKYCDAHVHLLLIRPDLTGIAVTQVGLFPAPQTLNEVTYEFFAVDEPEPDDSHHAEIRVRTDPTTRENKRINNGAVRRLLAESLARAFAVHTPP